MLTRVALQPKPMIHTTGQSMQPMLHHISYVKGHSVKWLQCCLDVLSVRVGEWECAVR